jgi:hypothetical protein
VVLASLAWRIFSSIDANRIHPTFPYLSRFPKGTYVGTPLNIIWSIGARLESLTLKVHKNYLQPPTDMPSTTFPVLHVLDVYLLRGYTTAQDTFVGTVRVFEDAPHLKIFKFDSEGSEDVLIKAFSDRVPWASWRSCT